MQSRNLERKISLTCGAMQQNVPTLSKSEAWIKQPYAITVAKHNFNVHEMRVMTRITQALQQDMLYGKTRHEVQKTLSGDKFIRIPTQTFLPKGSSNYAMVKRALKSLEQKTMLIRSKDKYGSYETTARLIMKSKYYLNNEMVEIQIDRDILPDYLTLASYSRYLAEVSFESSSRYIMRMYQFISHWKDKTKKLVMINELRDILEVGEKYGKAKDFRKYIIEPCMKDLKQRADVWFDIDATIKSGRSITGYVFKMYKRGDTTNQNNAVHEQNIQNILRDIFGLGDYHLNELRPIIQKSEYHPHIYEKIKDIETQISTGKVKSPKAYIVKALQNEFKEIHESKVYVVPESIRQQLQEPKEAQAANSLEKVEEVISEQRRQKDVGLVGDHIATLLSRRPTKE